MASTTTDSDGGGGWVGWFSDRFDSQSIEQHSDQGTLKKGGNRAGSKSLLVQGFNRLSPIEAKRSSNSGDWIAEFSHWVKNVVKHVAAVRFFKQDHINDVSKLPPFLKRTFFLKDGNYCKYYVSSTTVRKWESIFLISRFSGTVYFLITVIQIAL